MTSTDDETGDPFAPIEGIALPVYAAICRALLRVGGSTRGVAKVLATYGTTPDQWRLVNASWTERIRGYAAVRVEFGRLYAAPVVEPRDGNE